MVVQQQALRDFHAAYASWFAALAEWRTRTVKLPPEERSAAPSPPGWRKRDVNEGFRVVAVGPGDVRRLNRRWGEVLVPKLGWVRFHWSRPTPAAKSYRITRDRAGRWHVAFAAVPRTIPTPGTGEVVGVDRGVRVSAALSTGELLKTPRAAPDRTAQAAAAGAPQGPPAQGVAPPRADQARRRPAQGQRLTAGGTGPRR